jgi:hypothetical protein
MKVKELIELLLQENLEADVKHVHWEVAEGTMTSWPVELDILFVTKGIDIVYLN